MATQPPLLRSPPRFRGAAAAFEHCADGQPVNRLAGARTPTLGGLLHLALLVAVAALTSFSAPAFAACTWAGTPTLGLPEVTPLRAYQSPYRSPGRVAFDALGNAYVSDPGAGRVIVQDRWGRLVSELTALGRPMAIAVSDTGDILVGEQTSGSVSVFGPQWTLLYQLGQGAGEFLNPTDIAVDGYDGSVYVTDGGTHSIRKYDAGGGFVTSFGGFGDAQGLFDFPSAVHVSAAGEVLVGDQNNDRVQVFDRDGQFLRCFGSSSSFFFRRKFGRISGLTTDSQDRIYVSDSFQGHVKIFDLQSVLIGTIGEFGSGPGQLRTPVGIGIDPNNRLFLASQNTGRVELVGLDTFSDPHIVVGVAYVDPPQVKRDNKRKEVKVVIELIDADVYDVDLSSLTANGVPSELGSEAVGDADRNGIADISAKFAFDALIATVPDGESTVLVTGRLINGDLFEGGASITVEGDGALQVSMTAHGQRKRGGRI